MTIVVALGILASYLAGSIPFALLISRIFYGQDIRLHGSGNVGATNVYRVFGRIPGIACLVLDALKGLLPVLAGKFLHQQDEVIVAWAMVAIIGHSRSVFLRFGGGKSVATAAGAILAMSPLVGLITAGVWLLAFALTRIVSVGSLAAAGALPLAMFVGQQGRAYLLFSGLTAVFVIIRHRSNLKRLLAGQELRMEKKS